MRYFKIKSGIFFILFCVLGMAGCGSESLSECADVLCPEGQVCVDAPGEGAVCVDDPQWVIPPADEAAADGAF